jgi:hypothetical protein
MSSGAEARFFAKLAEAPIETAPFPHFYLENIFTDDLYSQMLGNLPADGDLIPLGDTGLVTPGAYPERAILRLNDADTARLDEIQRIFWQDVATRFLGGRLTEMLSGRFWPHILDRFGGNLLRMRLAEEAMLVRDRTRYALGPHTDAPHRLLTLLFYLPADNATAHLGTTLYAPIDATFRCKGGPHHPREAFNPVRTMPYRPNSVFAFMRTDQSFHGVEQIADEAVQRDILAYDIRIKGLTFAQPPVGEIAQAGATAQPAP